MQNGRSSTRVRTVSPMLSAVSSSPTTISAFALASAPMRCDPWPWIGRDLGATVGDLEEAADVLAEARRGLDVGRPARRAPSGGGMACGPSCGGWPAARTPRTTHRPTPGCPGSVMIGVCSSKTRPKPCGLPGCIATSIELDRAERRQRLLDDVLLALADAAARHDEVGADELLGEHLAERPAGRRRRRRPDRRWRRRRVRPRRACSCCRRRSSRSRGGSPARAARCPWT